MLNWGTNCMSFSFNHLRLINSICSLIWKGSTQTSWQLWNEKISHGTEGTRCWRSECWLIIQTSFSKHSLCKSDCLVKIDYAAEIQYLFTKEKRQCKREVRDYLTSILWTIRGMFSMSPTIYRVAFAGKYHRSWNFLILSTSHFLICSSNPIGNLLPSLFSECRCCNNYSQENKTQWATDCPPKIGQGKELLCWHIENYSSWLPGSQHDTQLYSSSEVLKVWPVFLSQLEKRGILGEKLSVINRQIRLPAKWIIIQKT